MTTTTTAWAASQAESLVTADNWGAGWVHDELDLLLSTMDEPVYDVAITLGRTVYAVSTMRALALAGHAGSNIRKPGRPEPRVCGKCFTETAANGTCLCG